MNSFYSESELNELGLKRIGQNVLISKKVSIYGAGNIEIGNHVRIDDYCVLSGKIVLDDYIHIAVYTCLFGGDSGIHIDSFSTLSSRCAVYSISDDYSGKHMTNPMLPEEFRGVTDQAVEIKKHVIVGTGSTILPGVTVGEGAAIGCMSLINRSVEPWGIYVGQPCRKIKERQMDALILEKEFINKMQSQEV